MPSGLGILIRLPSPFDWHPHTFLLGIFHADFFQHSCLGRSLSSWNNSFHIAGTFPANCGSSFWDWMESCSTHADPEPDWWCHWSNPPTNATHCSSGFIGYPFALSGSHNGPSESIALFRRRNHFCCCDALLQLDVAPPCIPLFRGQAVAYFP